MSTPKLTTVPTPTKPVVKIYVRLVDNDENRRSVAFRIPEGIDSLDLLERGFALDGNQAIFTVGPYIDHGPLGARSCFSQSITFGLEGGDELYDSLTEALRAAQRSLVKFLREQGFEPQFT